MPAPLFEKIKQHKVYAVSNDGMLCLPLPYWLPQVVGAKKSLPAIITGDASVGRLIPIALFDSLLSF